MALSKSQESLGHICHSSYNFVCWIGLIRLHVCPVLLSTVPSGLPLVQSSKRSHMHLSTSALSNASAGLHYSMPPCHYSNQQTTYGMMAGVLGRLAVHLRQGALQKPSFKA